MLTVTKTGITVDSYQTIYNRLSNQFKKIYGNDVNLDSDTPDGQLLALFAKEMETIHQSVSFIVQMLDPYQAMGQWLEQRALYAGIIRNTASYSYIDSVIITGKPNTHIPLNTVLIDQNKHQWIVTEAITLNELGSGRTQLRSNELGNYKVKINEMLQLSTIIIGIEKVIVNSESHGGSEEESDADLLKRFMLSHSINSNDERLGIKAALYNLPGVAKCEVYENYSHLTDDKGIPPHSINVVIAGGDDEEIAQTIARKKIGGCGLSGKLEKKVWLYDAQRLVRFDRPIRNNLTVSMRLGRYKSFSDIDTQSIEKHLMALDFEIGETVYATRLISSINLTNGFYIKSLTVNNSDICYVDYREYAAITKVEVFIDG